VIEAERAEGSYTMGTFTLPPDEDATWAEPDLPGVENRFCGRRSRLSIEMGADYDTVVISANNYAPTPASYFVEHGKGRAVGTAATGSEFEIEVAYDKDATELVIGSDVWKPSEALGSLDMREIGLAVKSIRLERRS
jgi:hypothetical protein